MENIKGKRLLILGGTSASFDLVRNAKSMGIYTIVTDPNQTGVAKELADETALVSTADIDGLVEFCRQSGVDGVFWAEPISDLFGGMSCFLTMFFTVYKKLPEEER